MINDQHLAEYRAKGLSVLRGIIDESLVIETRVQILQIVEELTGATIHDKESLETFQSKGTEVLWDFANREPQKRNLLYKYLQRIPAAHSYGNHPHLREFAKRLGLKVPSVRELNVQIYLPWEKCFYQPVHQDLGSLDSSESITFSIPMQPITEDTAIRYWIGSHVEGPVEHEEVVDEKYGVYHMKVPDRLASKYPTELGLPDAGDVVALNRVLFHSSPSFEKAMTIRSAVIVRYDELEGNGLYDGTGKYQHLSPFGVKRYQEEIVPKIREFLSKPPAIDWKEKVTGKL